MNVSRMSDKGAVATLNEICDGMCRFVKDNPDAESLLATTLREEIINDVEEEDGSITTFDTVFDICKELRATVDRKPSLAKDLLEYLIQGVLDPLAEDDFWGTEGWEHCFDIE